MVNHYELLYLIPAKFTDDELEPIKQKVRQIIEKSGATVTHEESLGKRRLAYVIKQESFGYYLLMEFDLEGADLRKLDNEIKLTEEVMRHTIVKRDQKAPSFREMTQRHERERAEQTQREVEEKKSAEENAKKKEKVDIKELDNKLDEILEGEIM